jgi:hypothetical protein
MLMLVVLTIQVPLLWIQMDKYGKEQISMMVKLMVRKNTKEMPTIFKHLVISKRLLPTPDYHTPQPYHKRKQPQLEHLLRLTMLLQQYSLVQQVSHILQVPITTQEHPAWTQML